MVHGVVVCVPTAHALCLIKAFLNSLLFNFCLHLLLIQDALIISNRVELCHDVVRLLKYLVVSILSPLAIYTCVMVLVAIRIR